MNVNALILSILACDRKVQGWRGPATRFPTVVPRGQLENIAVTLKGRESTMLLRQQQPQCRDQPDLILILILFEQMAIPVDRHKDSNMELSNAGWKQFLCMFPCPWRQVLIESWLSSSCWIDLNIRITYSVTPPGKKASVVQSLQLLSSHNKLWLLQSSVSLSMPWKFRAFSICSVITHLYLNPSEQDVAVKCKFF